MSIGLALGAHLGKTASGGGGAAPPVPLTIPNLAAWYDASQITGLANGAAVAQWDDESGNGKHATQATAGSRPAYQTAGLNGLPSVRFDGTDDVLPTAAIDLSGTGAVTVFVVASVPADGAAHGLVEHAPDFTGGGIILYRPATTVTGGHGGNSGSAWYATGGSLGTTAKLVTLVSDKSLASSEAIVYLNNVADGATQIENNNTVLAFPNAAINIGCRAGLIGMGDIAEVALYSRALTTQERADWWAYADAKWGL